MEELWNKNLPFMTFKLAINKSAKFHSLLLDKNSRPQITSLDGDQQLQNSRTSSLPKHHLCVS